VAESEPQLDLTGLLRKASKGDDYARDQLFSVVYDELRRVARRAMQGERRDHTLQPTALVHETFLRLAGARSIEWEDRKHFFVVAAKTMRRILVDHARGLHSIRRNGGQKMDLTPNLALTEENADDVLAVDEALARLELIDARQSRVVELRYFGGLSNDETASLLGVDSRTVKRDWQVARAWLHSQLAD
jgi:RNA polymerase sigma-70 factor (ECF subfamily)